jgi:hypothetical protein
MCALRQVPAYIEAHQAKVQLMAVEATPGGPMALPLDLVDEDPQQPRTKDNPGFSAKSLTELAAAIRLRGVKTPISVRPDPAAPGRYLINHGARRYRASRLAGLATIPSFIDANYNHADQVVETRPSVRMLRAFIEQKSAMAQDAEPHAGESVLVLARSLELTEAGTELAGPASWVNPVLAVRHKGREGRLLMRRRPSAVGKAWMRYDDDCELAEVELAEIELVALMEG